MDFFEKVAEKVTTTGKEVYETAKDTKDIMRLKMKIKSDEHEIAKQMYLIGGKFYEANKDIYDEEYAKYFEKIQMLKDSIADKEEEIAEVGRK